SQKLILYEFRIPKALSAILVGTALSVSGFQMQTVFRNPLAGPYILGISSGASLGVALIIIASAWLNLSISNYFISNLLIVISAFIGSSLVLILILFISKKIRNVLTILIFGVLFGYLTSSIVSVLQYFATNNSLKSFFVWTMGSLGNTSLGDTLIFGIIVFVGFIISLILSKKLNLLMLGEDYAQTSGVNVKVVRILLFVSTSLLAGSVVAFCGPIGFVGITVPHIVRMLFKTNSALKIQILAIFIGSIIMLLSDIISQIIFTDVVLPINSITAFFGIPVIFYILLSKKEIVSI
ncbi:MAG: iron ABC transporter permease, partial [Bacteroidetes bacterium]